MSSISNVISAMNVGYCHTNKDAFPCDEGAIVLVSMGLAAAGLGLCMVVFLMHEVRWNDLFDPDIILYIL